MAHMSLNINHDIAVMTVFDLENVADYWVSGKTVAEVVSGFFITIWILPAKLLKEIVI